MKTIIAPTDFSSAAHNAVDYAVELAKFFNSRLILVNAYHPTPPADYEFAYTVELSTVLKNNSVEKLNDLKNEICKKNGRELDIKCISEMGFSYDTIKAVAEKYDANLVVMGIVGEAGKIKKHLIGSTAIKVARDLDVPTFIIPENVKYHRIHKISFACDFKKTENTDLIYVAKFFSKVFDAELEIVNVEKPKEFISIDKAVTNLFIEEKLEHVRHKTVHITGNNVALELEDYFHTYESDVIMINPKKHNLFYYLFNHSITKELAYNARLPVLAIH